MNIVVIFLGVSVGATAKAESFLSPMTLGILAMGIVAFMCGTAGGVLLAKFMNIFLPEGKKINPLIGSAGVSAVPMAARVSQKEGQREDPSNFLLMHAMGPNVAGVIGSAVAAGVFRYGKEESAANYRNHPPRRAPVSGCHAHAYRGYAPRLRAPGQYGLLVAGVLGRCNV